MLDVPCELLALVEWSPRVLNIAIVKSAFQMGVEQIQPCTVCVRGTYSQWSWQTQHGDKIQTATLQYISILEQCFWDIPSKVWKTAHCDWHKTSD